jgi:hypothetical protein
MSTRRSEGLTVRTDDQQCSGLGRRKKLGTERGIRGRSPVGDFSAVDDGERPPVRAIEQDTDSLHRGQRAADEIRRKAGDQLAGHVPAAVDRVAHEVLRVLAAEQPVLDFDLRAPVGRLHGRNEHGKRQQASDVVGIHESHSSPPSKRRAPPHSMSSV